MHDLNLVTTWVGWLSLLIFVTGLLLYSYRRISIGLIRVNRALIYREHLSLLVG